MALSNRDRVGQGLEQLAKGLVPFVDEHVADLPQDDDGDTWAPVLLLKVIIENSVFADFLSTTEIAFAAELHGVAVRLADSAHTAPFNEADTLRTLDTAVRLLRAVGAVPEAAAVERSLLDFQQLAAERRSRKVERVSVILPGMEGLGLKPWREVITPHRDIIAGNFNASQFAANLYNVVNEKATREYLDPAEFFHRTYLTEGLKDLLTRAIRRVSGDANASPIINLQTNFGGGKTHSMLALYHIFSDTETSKYPQEVQELADGIDLRELGQRVRRVVISGQDLSPKLGVPKEDGTTVKTLWGEIAWQLGGRAAYDRLAGADETGTNPGDVIQNIIEEHSPCLILIDEWVAYARQLYNNDKLPAGTFDAQFTFAQRLTEAVSAVPGAMLAVTIPASDTEVGGTNGKEALERLQNLVRRVADPWKPATSKESFEIVRRRLFQDVDGEGEAHIAAVARRFVTFYAEHHGEFPPACATESYEADIRAAYPIHPELFQRLYDDWSTLERFQRTRGVLSLMSNVIQVLWEAKDASPMIMPATVPLLETRVGGQLDQYLDDTWAPIISRDVEGPDSTPAEVDRDRPLYGQRSLTERLARTIFIGSAATLKTPNKGIGPQRIWLGTAVPGEPIGHFGSALHLLAERATYLYTENDRYWYDTAQSVTKTVREHAERLRDQPERVWQELTERLRQASGSRRGSFAAVHPCPTDSSEIPDEDRVRLVIIHPDHSHRRGNANSTAMEFARDALRNRGNVARRHSNMLVFLAGDTERMLDLEDAARDFLAWKEVAEHVDDMNLAGSQQRRVRERRQAAHRSLDQVIGDTYTWTLVPDQPDGGKPAVMSAIRTDSASAGLVERVSERLIREGKLAERHAPQNIRFVLREKLSGVWERKGSISVGELWALYARYSYMPRLRDRSVLVTGIREVLGVRAWENDGFALATSVNGEFKGLAVPGTGDVFGEITDGALLVVPELALRQRSRQEAEAGTTEASAAEATGTTVTLDAASGAGTTAPFGNNEVSRFFGLLRISGERYGKAFKDVQLEILPHLDDPDTELEITVEIKARRDGGFSDEKQRIVKENAQVLKFKQAEFEN
jgi:predicted AAA+ superfamily ATPase